MNDAQHDLLAGLDAAIDLVQWQGYRVVQIRLTEAHCDALREACEAAGSAECSGWSRMRMTYLNIPVVHAQRSELMATPREGFPNLMLVGVSL